MSARKSPLADHAPKTTAALEPRQVRLSLSSDAVLISKNGVEFRSPEPFPVWAEMTASIQTPADGGEVTCTGIVVACTGNRHLGYCVSLLFSGLSAQTEKRLAAMASLSAG
jgi:hypothetical protein